MQIVHGAGTASAFDQAAVVHSIWLQLVELRCGAWIERVPTADNLADLPSRRVFTWAAPYPR